MARDFIFDLDGTLVDSLPGIRFSIDVALAPFEQCPENLRAMIGPPIRTILRAAVSTASEERLHELEQLFRRSYDSEGWRKTVCYPGAKETLRSLHASGSRLFLVTNKPSLATDKILNAFDMHRYFKDVLTPDSNLPAFRGKPEMLRFLMQRHGITVDECLMVGDTAEDYEAASALRMPVAIMVHGYGCDRISPGIPDSCRTQEFSQILSHCRFQGSTA